MLLMPHTTKLIQLSADDLLTLIKEKTIQRGDIVISSTTSFLSILGMLEHEMIKEMSSARSKPA
jgi:hypothetical protein